jgi:hypothetical protein
MQAWLAGQSFVLKHWTQASAWQTGVAAGQSEFCAQTTQVPSDAQILPGSAEQSELAMHWTHDDVEVSHKGRAPPHVELPVQPGRHVKMPGWQMGAAVPQSELSRHSTHRPPAASQRGAEAGQSLFCAHCTHVAVVVSHTRLGPTAQSVDVLHPMQAPGVVVVSQIGASGGHIAFCVQPAWHW